MKKPSKQKPSQPKRGRNTRRAQTGVHEDFKFFLGGEAAVAGVMHYKPPRRAREYQGMEVHEIVRRIMNDIGELRARAYPSASDEWAQSGSTLERRLPITYKDRLRTVLKETVAESLCPGLMARVCSPDQVIREAALKEYNERLGKLVSDEPKAAASGLAFIGKEAALYLENLSAKRSALMRKVAADLDLWPVNLGLKTRASKTGEHRQTVTRKKFADGYIKGLGLNFTCKWPTGHAGGAAEVSPFKLAVESLYRLLLLLKHSGSLAFERPTPWATTLFDLPPAMTKSNASRWWGVAKVYLDEQWEKHRPKFEPLIKHRGLSSSKKTPSEIKSMVIDDSLKKAFLGLSR